MKEIELDIWFYDLPACWQEEITGITREHYGLTDENDGTPEGDACYEFFDNAVADWWNDQDYETKLKIYKGEELAR